MHLLGMGGIPRRIPTYPKVYESVNLIITFGSYISMFSAMLFLGVVLGIYRQHMSGPRRRGKVFVHHSLLSKPHETRYHKLTKRF